jgi:hypothetical protein
MTAHGGCYQFAAVRVPDGGVIVWLTAWCGRSPTWATIGSADGDVCVSMTRLGINPIRVLVEAILA